MRDGTISTEWNPHSWAKVWLLDPQGVIRYRELRGKELKDAVDALLKE
jgi:hypothetical protein